MAVSGFDGFLFKLFDPPVFENSRGPGGGYERKEGIGHRYDTLAQLD